MLTLDNPTSVRPTCAGLPTHLVGRPFLYLKPAACGTKGSQIDEILLHGTDELPGVVVNMGSDGLDGDYYCKLALVKTIERFGTPW